MKREQLRNSNAYVLCRSNDNNDTESYMLVSYETPIAIIDTEDKGYTLYVSDAFDYSQTTSTHFTKFLLQFGVFRDGSDITNFKKKIKQLRLERVSGMFGEIIDDSYYPDRYLFNRLPFSSCSVDWMHSVLDRWCDETSLFSDCEV